MTSQLQQVRQLAQLHGVQTFYYDVFRRRKAAAPESLLKVLQALGVCVETQRDVTDALRARRQELWRRLCEPVIVAWDGEPPLVELQLPLGLLDDARVACQLTLETGEEKRWDIQLLHCPVVREAEGEGANYLTRQLMLPGSLPWGYHQLRFEAVGQSGTSLVISAPRRAFAAPQKTWGMFLPLYALHSQQSWGGGDFSDFTKLSDWVSEIGGKVVATLPLLTAFLDDPFDPSPYAPVSRLFWNEFYIDVTQIPELQRCQDAQALLASTAIQQELAALRSAPLVDYRRQMTLKRRILERLAQSFFANQGEHDEAFRQYVETHPAVEDYACFRAVGERLRAPWPQWPQPLRDGVVHEQDTDDAARRYHLYAQWITHEQLQILSHRAAAQETHLYLDLPLGVHLHGYDVWREREVFVVDASGGAPPDAVFTKGQDWGFPPLHPERLREQGYRYVIAYVQHHLRQAGALRIDHVMGLHRSFWTPKGLTPSEGVYVRYAAEELYAILCLESHRHKATIVGENLGTVPVQVNAAMKRHGIHRLYVVQYEFPALDSGRLRSVSSGEVASINTHDMPPFAAFWEGLDLHERFELGLMDAAGFQRERQLHETRKEALITFLQRQGWLPEPTTDPQEILLACLSFIAASPARMVLLNAEDLWLETRPQNFPGTGEERPNWRKKTADRFELWSQHPRVTTALQAINFLWKRKRR
ncbi:MAG: 4-alpha-glucanotransferase [Candidatus Binatia bacterium]